MNPNIVEELDWNWTWSLWNLHAETSLRGDKRPRWEPLNGCFPMEINTVSHESWVHTQGRTCTSEMHLIRCFWLLDTSGRTIVGVKSPAHGLLNHRRGRYYTRGWRHSSRPECEASASVGLLRPCPEFTSQPDGWRVAGVACSLASGCMWTLIASPGTVPAHWAWHPGPSASYRAAAHPPNCPVSSSVGSTRSIQHHFFRNVWPKKEGYKILLFAPAAIRIESVDLFWQLHPEQSGLHTRP